MLHPLVRLLVPMIFALPAFAGDEVPIQFCDVLPVIQVHIGSDTKRLLVDTAATTILNSNAFPMGQVGTVSVTSWAGTASSTARLVFIPEMKFGAVVLRDLRLSAVDLTAIGKACGGVIDGILGADLLNRLGVTLDLKNKVVRTHSADMKDDGARVAELHQQLTDCTAAFNRDDADGFAACLDPDVVLYTIGGELRGRNAAMQYLEKNYLHREPKAHLVVRCRAHHPVGELVWLEYDFQITGVSQPVSAIGMALCRKLEGHWVMVNMHHSAPSSAQVVAN
jgi:SnoaL-like protein